MAPPTPTPAPNGTNATPEHRPPPALPPDPSEADIHSSQRACFLLQVKREQLAGYLEVHQRVWPEMQDALSRCGWRRYSLFVRPDDGLVVGYFESDDVNAALTAMESQPVNARWQAEMAQYFVQPSGGIAQQLSQYFFLA